MALLSVTAEQYLYTNIAVSFCVSGGVNAGLCYVLYPSDSLGEKPLGVFNWPATIAGDLVVTSVVMGIMTWILSGGLTLADSFNKYPIHITSDIEIPPPYWVLYPHWPTIRPLLFNDPARSSDASPEFGCFAALANEFRTGLGLGIVAAVFGFLVSLVLLVKTSAWSTEDMIMLKAVFGAIVEVPITWITARVALEQCRERNQAG